MNLMLVRHLWGVPGSYEELFPRFKDRGYTAIETPIPDSAEDRARLREQLDKHGLDYIPQIFTSGHTVEEHVASFKERVEAARSLRPRFINSHSGRDIWSYDDSVRFYEQALTIEADTGIAVAHETHRGRVLFYPTVSHNLLECFDNLKLCSDLSHWVCVCERLLDDQPQTLALVAQRTIHIHARVGYEEGPQVPDPRAPEYLRYVEAHERWWNLIWDAQESRGLQTSTLTPEFGPPGYLHTLPYTQAPVADLEAICDWQARRQAENFARRATRA